MLGSVAVGWGSLLHRQLVTYLCGKCCAVYQELTVQHRPTYTRVVCLLLHSIGAHLQFSSISESLESLSTDSACSGPDLYTEIIPVVIILMVLLSLTIGPSHLCFETSSADGLSL